MNPLNRFRVYALELPLRLFKLRDGVLNLRVADNMSATTSYAADAAQAGSGASAGQIPDYF